MKSGQKNGKCGIICGTDFSIHAAEAANAAVAFAKRLDEKLTLIHVQEFGALGAAHPESFVTAQDKTRQLLEEETGRLRKRHAMVQSEILSGSVHEALIKTATAANARLVVVASLGHIAIGPILAGSVAVRVAETSPLPTLVVRNGGCLATWAGGQRRLKVLVGCDFSASADAAMDWVRWLQGIGSCDVTVAHVDWPPEELKRLGLQGTVPLVGNLPEVERALERDLKAKTAAIFGLQPVALCVVPAWGRPEVQLIQLAQREQADLLVVGTHQRRGLNRFWLGSVSRGVLHHAPMSVAVVPAAPTPAAFQDGIPEVKRVLATTDFSALGDRAVPYAYAALARGGTVKLIHVIPPWEWTRPLVGHYQPKRLNRKQQNQLVANSLKNLRALIPPEAAARGILTEIEVIEHYDVPTGICQVTERFGADMVCLGSHGRSGLSKALLGSVAQKVMIRSLRPLLVVRPPPR